MLEVWVAGLNRNEVIFLVVRHRDKVLGMESKQIKKPEIIQRETG